MQGSSASACSLEALQLRARRAPRAGSSSISDDPDAPPEGERMNRRRTNATELSAALAAKNFNADQLLGEKSGKGSGKKKK